MTQSTISSYHAAGHAIMVALSPYHELGKTKFDRTNMDPVLNHDCECFAKEGAESSDVDLWMWRIAAAGGVGETLLEADVDAFELDRRFEYSTPGGEDIASLDGGPFLVEDDGSDWDEVRQRRTEALFEVRRLLLDRVDAVRAVATALFERGTASPSEVMAALGQSNIKGTDKQ